MACIQCKSTIKVYTAAKAGRSQIPSATPERLLLWWCLSGSIPKYLEWLVQAGENTFEELVSNTSPLIEKGLHRLIEDFGSEHRTYFDVLAAIAQGHTPRARIENYLEIGVGPVLENTRSRFCSDSQVTTLNS